jgi:hypothetical protein
MAYLNLDPTVYKQLYDSCTNDAQWDVRGVGTASDCRAGSLSGAYPNVILMDTGTDTGGKCSANFTGKTGANVNNMKFGSIYTYQAMINIDTLADVTDDYVFIIGQTDGWVFGGPGNGVYFTYDRSTNVNWLCVSNNASTPTSTDSGVAVTAGWHKLEIQCDASSAKYFIDGVLVATNTTNLPTSGFSVNSFLVFKSAGTNSRKFYQNYFNYIQVI